MGWRPVIEQGRRILHAGDNGPTALQRAAKANQQSLLIRTHCQRLDVESTAALDIRYCGRCCQHRMGRCQRALESAHPDRPDRTVLFNTKPDQFVAGLLLVTVAIARMRRDGVRITRLVQRQAFQIIKLPGTIVIRLRRRTQQFSVDAPIRVDPDQTEGMLFFILYDQETPVR